MSRVSLRRLLQEGFTLIELMVVIALIGILSAMILPEMRGTYEDALLRSTSRHLVNLCNLAYSRAVSMQQVHRLRLDPKTGRFSIEQQDARASQRDGFAPLRDVAGSQGDLDGRIVVLFHGPAENPPQGTETVESPAMTASDASTSGEVVLGFYPDGTADPGEIELQDRQGFRLLLRLSPITARVRVLELPRQ